MANKIINLSSIVSSGNVEIKEDSHINIDCDADIKVLKNVNVSLYEVDKSYNINLCTEENSFVTYNTVEAQNCKKNFNIEGSLKYVEIITKPTNEELNINLNKDGANCDCKVLSISLHDEYQFNQKVVHNAQHTESNISNVGVAIDGAVVTFDTTGKIEKGMAKTRCSQLSKGIVMDDISSITAKPILLIDEFDCFANHGASIGKMSDEDLFYLMSRGLDKNEAFLLILQGMIKPFIDSLELDDLKQEINTNIQNMIVK